MDLKLDITIQDPDLFRIEDLTYYTVTGTTTLTITPPALSAITITGVTNDVFDINAVVIGIIPSGSTQTLPALPEGVYSISYTDGTNSVCYKYMHIAPTYKNFIGAICTLYGKRSSMTLTDFNKSREELWKISKMLKDCKYLVEECFKEDIGLELFSEVSEMISKFSPCYNGCSSC